MADTIRIELNRESNLSINISGKRDGDKILHESNEHKRGGDISLFECSTYIFEVAGDKTETRYSVAISNSTIAKGHNCIVTHYPLPGRKCIGEISTGNYVGNLDILIIEHGVHGGPDVTASKIKVEIRSSKIDYERDYQQMLTDIASYFTDLLLQHGSLANQVFDVDEETDSNLLYQRFAFLKALVENEYFKEAILKITSCPTVRWKEESIRRPIIASGRISRKTAREIASGQDRELLSEETEIYGLKSLPRSINVNNRIDNTDNIENQFVKYVLNSFSHLCEELSKNLNASERLKAEAKETLNYIDDMLSIPFFNLISDSVRLNVNSPVLQRKDGYREVYVAWLKFQMAARLSWEGGDEIYEAGKKNVAKLYEYWLFFKLIEVMEQVFIMDIKDISKLIKSDNDNLSLFLSQGTTHIIKGKTKDGLNLSLSYNRTFSKGKRKESWSLEMRPDYTISIWPKDITETEAIDIDRIAYIHFDAKYRVDKIANGEYSESYKPEDLTKMHAYKDAIRNTMGAYTLYPGNCKKIHREQNGIVPGIGAFPARPNTWHKDTLGIMDFLSEATSCIGEMI